MGYIWQSYRKEKKFHISDTLFSPYLEIAEPDRSAPKGITGDFEDVNPMIRFEKIFKPLLRSGISEKDKEKLENILFHYLARLDRKTGIHSVSLEEIQLAEKINQGTYGEDNKKRLNLLESAERKWVLHYLRLQIANGERKLYFEEALHRLFPRAALYYYPTDQVFIVYLRQLQNNKDQAALKLLESLFMDLTNKPIRIFWGWHFGIIGNEATMRMNGIQLY